MKNYALQHLKTLMVLGVVVNHAWAASQYITTPQIPTRQVVSWFSNVLIVSGLPVFFFLSGYFAWKKGEEILTCKGYAVMLRTKVYSLVIPYLSWNLFFILFYRSLGGVIPRISERIADFKLDTIWGCFNLLLGITRSPIDSPLWFIRDLFLIFCVMPLIVWFLKRLGWVFLILLTSLMMFATPVYGRWYSIVMFTFGLWFARSSLNFKLFIKWRWLSIPLWVLSSIVLYHLHLGPNIAVGFYFLAIAAWLGMSGWTNFHSDSFFARYVTPASFFIYASHFLFCSCLLHTLAPHICDSRFKLMILYGVFIGLGGMVILLFFQLGKRLCPKVMAIISGGRVS